MKWISWLWGWRARRIWERKFARILLSRPDQFSYSGLGWRNAAKRIVFIERVGNRYGVAQDCIDEHIKCVVERNFLNRSAQVAAKEAA